MPESYRILPRDAMPFRVFLYFYNTRWYRGATGEALPMRLKGRSKMSCNVIALPHYVRVEIRWPRWRVDAFEVAGGFVTCAAFAGLAVVLGVQIARIFVS